MAEGNKPSGSRLISVATPIGNLGDLSPRAVEVLTEADFWIVEDSRVSGRLAAHLGFKKPMSILNDHTSPSAIEKYLDQIEDGKTAALLTDGGAPSISDPGALLVDGAYSRGVEVDAIPGPSAVIDALMLSGFFAQRFAFLGFLGRKSGDIRKELLPFEDSPMTLVLFESPHRIDAFLQVAAEIMPERRYALCRELTKLHQQVWRGTLPNLPKVEEMARRGEFTIVLEGKRRARTGKLTGTQGLRTR